MHTHIRVLAILEIVYASIGMLFGLGLFTLFGGIATIVGFNADASDRAIAVPVLALIGTIAAGMFITLSLPRLIAGIGLLKQRSWARLLTIVVSAVGLFDVPAGLALGLYGLWVLFTREGAAAFEEQVAARS